MAPTTLLPWSWPPTWSGWSPSHRFSSDFRFDPLKSLYFRFLDFRLKIWASGLSFPVKVWFLCCVHIHHDSLVELAFTVNRLVFVSFAAGRLSKIFIQRCFHLSVTQFDNILDHISLWKKECIRNISQSLKENDSSARWFCTPPADDIINASRTKAESLTGCQNSDIWDLKRAVTPLHYRTPKRVCTLT